MYDITLFENHYTPNITKMGTGTQQKQQQKKTVNHLSLAIALPWTAVLCFKLPICLYVFDNIMLIRKYYR